MSERLVDILNGNDAVVHTFPVTVGNSSRAPADAEYQAKGIEAARHAQLVPDSGLGDLKARMHVSRGGALQPYGDEEPALSQTKQGLDQIVRERAYFLWEAEGRPEGRANEHWHRAHHQHLCERAYVLWQQQGCPEGQADQLWHRVVEFERQ